VWEFREDRARYREEAAGESNLSLLSRHILEMELPAEPAARAAAARLRETAAAEGVVAIVTMASGEILTVGYSERFAGEYPLRVAEQATDCGLVPGDFPVIRITLESTY
jgi:hypothetical protein